MRQILFTLTVLFMVFSVATSAFAQDNIEQEKAWQFFEEIIADRISSSPNEPITRGEVALVLAELFSVVDLDGEISFKDVSENHPYLNAIKQVVDSKVMTGYENQTFRPDAALTRAQMAKIITLQFKLEGQSSELPFKDVAADAWFYPYVNQLYSLGLTKGTTAHTFSPDALISRKEFALMLYRLHEKSSLSVDYTVIAGSKGYGYLDGQALEAKFRVPQQIAKVNGDYYISDMDNHMIRIVSNQQVSTYTGDAYFIEGDSNPASMLLDGDLEIAMFQSPMGIVAKDDGTLFIADSGNHVIRKITADGKVTTFAGSGKPGSKDGKAEQAEFNYPYGLALATDGTLYVSDTLNHTIRKITAEGGVSTLTNNELRIVEMANGYIEVAGNYQNGKISEAHFNEPTSLLLDASGNLFVSDSGNHVIRYIDFKADTVTTFAGHFVDNGIYGKHGHLDGQVEKAQFYYPRGLAIDEKGQLYVADSLNHAIRVISNGEVTTFSENNQLPTDLLIDQNELIVVQSGSGEIGKYKLQ